MRVAYVATAGGLGGAERSLLDLILGARAVAGEGPGRFEATLVLPGDGPLAREAARAGVATEVVAMPPALGALGDSALRGPAPARAVAALARRAPAALGALGGYALRLGRALRALRPDVVHSNSLRGHALTPALRRAGVPVVWHLRDFVGERPLAARLLRPLARGAALGLAISRAVAADARRALPSLPVRVVYNAVDLERFSPGPGDGAWLDEAAGLPAASDALRVGLVATYARWKGHEVFLEALAASPSALAGRPVRGYVIGGPIYETWGSQHLPGELERRARDLGLGARVGFVPFQDDPAPVYRALDVVVHASTRPEPFGRTIAEGMACGRAVVVARTGGAAELFWHGREALGIPPNDPRALAAALEALADAGLRARLGAAARTAAEERFARARLGREVLAHYAAVLGDRAAARGAR